MRHCVTPNILLPLHPVYLTSALCLPLSYLAPQGRNLLCIHSKKHIKNPPEHVAQKQAQNLESMQVVHDVQCVCCGVGLY